MDIKIPLYNILNIFLPGLILIVTCVFLFFSEARTLAEAVGDIGSTGFEIVVTVSLFAVAYKIGYIVFKIGAIAIEPLLKRMFWWTDYNLFVAAGKTSEKAHDKLETLSREYGYVRTQIALCAVLALLAGIRGQWWLLICCVFCVILFTISVHGHMRKIHLAVTEYMSTSNNSIT